MKKVIPVLFLNLLFFCCHSPVSQSNKETQHLFPVIEQGLWGFIDQSGEKIIPCQFKAVGHFSEGLVPVRLDGTYGFIDRNNQVVIPYQYDFAEPFKNGWATVYLNGQTSIINKQGNTAFEHSYKKMESIEDSDLFKVYTSGNQYGLINNKGELVLDTIYEDIGDFKEGLTVVIRDLDEDKRPEEGVIKSNGDFVVPFGEYEQIGDFINGFAPVRVNEEAYRMGVIDTSGVLLFTVPEKQWRFDNYAPYFYEGLAVIELDGIDEDSTENYEWYRKNQSKGVINTQGEIVFSNRAFEEILPFNNNRTFARDTNSIWYVINRKGEYVGNQAYREILYEPNKMKAKKPFENGFEIVKVYGGWAMINTNNQIVKETQEWDFLKHFKTQKGSVIFFDEYHNGVQNSFGFWDLDTEVLVRKQFEKIHFSDFSKGLLYAQQNGREGYVNQKGEFVWIEPEKPDKPLLNIDYLNRGYFYAAAKVDDLNGAWKSENNFKSIQSAITSLPNFANNELSLLIQKNDSIFYEDKYQGSKLYLANTSQNNYFFGAQDSRMYLFTQAQNQEGDWERIEYIPSSWCGNSYHSLVLPANHYWEFTIPKYEGAFQTKLRLKLYYKKSEDQEESDILLSEEFSGSVNPGQFWRYPEYSSSGLMDPYSY